MRTKKTKTKEKTNMSKGAIGGVVLAAALVFGGIGAFVCTERIRPATSVSFTV